MSRVLLLAALFAVAAVAFTVAAGSRVAEDYPHPEPMTVNTAEPGATPYEDKP